MTNEILAVSERVVMEFNLEEILKMRREKIVGVGWFQDLAGNLYHYDGVVWDVVPDSSLELQFLG